MDEHKYRQKKKTEHLNHYKVKYGIDIPHATHSELLEYIFRYEMENLVELVKSGLDPITGEVGYFIII